MRIVYVVPAHPLFSHTFIVNEMIKMQEFGQEIILAPLHSASNSSVRHKSYDQLQSLSILPAPLFNLGVGVLALRMFFSKPVTALKTLIALHYQAGLNIYAQGKLIALVPKAMATAWRLRQEKVDWIHAHFASHTATCAGIVASLIGIPFSFTAHAYDVYNTTPRHRNKTLHWSLRHATRVFAVSHYMADLLRKRLPKRNDHISTAYVGIPLDLFRPYAAPSRDSGIRLLCIARFDELKGIDTLIDACSILRVHGLVFHLYIYGDGPLRKPLIAQVARLHLESCVTIGDAICQEEVARQMRGCHAFVMPCRQNKSGDMDGIPTVFMEAMAIGRPVVSCGISGIPELVRPDETGLLVPQNDARAVAMAILRLARDDRLRIRLGQQARALIEQQHDNRFTTRRLLQTISAAANPVRESGGSRVDAPCNQFSQDSDVEKTVA